MTTLLTKDLIDRCHAGSCSKGFWDETPNERQQLMLVVSELAESLEAHRKGKVADWAKYNERTAELVAMGPQYESFQPVLFQDYLKDSIGDEIADAAIRLCDYAGGFFTEPLDIEHLLICYGIERKFARVEGDNYGSDLLTVTQVVVNERARGGLSSRSLAEAFAIVEALADAYKVDLATHIDLKLKYNQSRPARHGKAY
ncbi:MAG: hypothetical protein ACRYFX_18625 [Janthinobacterium lividum]